MSERVLAALGTDLPIDDAMDTFTYAGGRDLTGYVDGTANPEGEEAIAVAVADGANGLDAIRAAVEGAEFLDKSQQKGISLLLEDAWFRLAEMIEELKDEPKGADDAKQ